MMCALKGRETTIVVNECLCHSALGLNAGLRLSPMGLRGRAAMPKSAAVPKVFDPFTCFGRVAPVRFREVDLHNACRDLLPIASQPNLDPNGLLCDGRSPEIWVEPSRPVGVAAPLKFAKCWRCRCSRHD